MKNFEVKLSSSPETPKDEMLFVVEYPEQVVSRIKVTSKNIEKEIENLTAQKTAIEERLTELTAIDKEIKKQLKKI
jgi:hypothetical protein